MFYNAFHTPTSPLRRDMDRLIDAVFAPALANGADVSSAWTPTTDIRESDRDLVIELDVPGVDPAGVDVTADRGLLRVRGERASARQAAAQRLLVAERVYGPFERVFRLPKGADESAITAEFTHGVLTIRLPKSALPKPRRIAVTVAGGHSQGGDGSAAAPVGGNGTAGTQGADGEATA